MSAARRLRVVDQDRPARFGIAVRVSRVMGRSGDAFLSPEVQEASARRAVAQVGGVVEESVGQAGVFFDLDVSGAIAPSDRPGLGAALELVRAGALDGVAVHDLSRWSRETVSGLRELEAVAAIGGQVISAGEHIDLKTPGGRFSTTVQLAANQLRRDEASRAWKSTIQARFERGQHHGVAPLGYVWQNRQLVPDPGMAGVVREAFVDVAAGAASLSVVARRLSQARGSTVWPQTAGHLLRSPVYLGLVELHGQTRPGLHEPLVDQATWDRAQQRLTAAAGQPRVATSTPHALAGLLVCDECDRAVWRRRRANGRNDSDARVTCKTKRIQPGACPGIGTPLLEPIEDLVLAAVLRHTRQLRDDAAALAAQRSARARAGADATALRAELASTEKAIGKAAALLAREVYTESQYAAAVAELEAAKTAVQQRLAVVETVAGGPEPEQLASAAERLAVVWHRMQPGERRAALQPFVGQVRLLRATRPRQPLEERVLVLDHAGRRLG